MQLYNLSFGLKALTIKQENKKTNTKYREILEKT